MLTFALEKTRRLYYRAAYVRCGAPTHTPRFWPRRRDRRKLEAQCPIRSKLYTDSEAVRIHSKERRYNVLIGYNGFNTLDQSFHLGRRLCAGCMCSYSCQKSIKGGLRSLAHCLCQDASLLMPDLVTIMQLGLEMLSGTSNTRSATCAM